MANADQQLRTPIEEAHRPNIVLIMTDQQRFDTIRALGYDHMDTPHLDRLAADGTVFDHTFVTAPSCAPSRASLFTGLYPHSSGVMKNEDVWRHSWVEALAGAGYYCVNVGKMHTYPYETPAGFHERHCVENKDRVQQYTPFYLDTWDKALWTRRQRRPGRLVYRDLPDYRERLGAFTWDLPEDLHPDNFVGDLATWWLSRYPGREPFFLQIGFPGPHPPYDPPARYLDRYRGRQLPMPIPAQPGLADQPTALQVLRKQHLAVDHDAIVHLAEPTDEQLRRQRLHYYANISLIDDQIGAVRAALADRGVLDDTVIIFTSDHGDCLNDHGHSQKWTMYEPSVRVPAIVWGPTQGVQNRRIEALTSMMDLGATVLDLAGLTIPRFFEAQSLVPALRGEPWPGREYVLAEHARDEILTGTELMTMVRSTHWKLVEFSDSEDGQLFDLADDPAETVNLWARPSARGVRDELVRVIERWRATSSLRTSTRTEDIR